MDKILMKQIVAVIILLIAANITIASESGIFADKIVFGQTAVTAGPADELGIGMQNGILAAFKEINDQGGINNRILKLITYNDGYEPKAAIDNTIRLINDDKVFALIGGVGTPTANAIEPITSKNQVPFIAPFTGAEFLRSPFKRYVVNIRGSYWQETESWIEHLTNDLNIKKIAIFYQDDSYGRAGLSGVERAMEKRKLELLGEATYRRNTTAVKSAVLTIRKLNPEAIVMIGAYKPCAEFIKIAKSLQVNAYFINISFVGSKALAKELGYHGKNVIISQVVPFPFDSKVPIVKSYQQALKKYNPKLEFGFVSLEGYISGRFVIKILQQLGEHITRESFLDYIYKHKKITLDNLVLQFAENDNQGMDKVFLTVLQENGIFNAVNNIKEIKIE